MIIYIYFLKKKTLKAYNLTMCIVYCFLTCQNAIGVEHQQGCVVYGCRQLWRLRSACDE